MHALAIHNERFIIFAMKNICFKGMFVGAIGSDDKYENW